MSAAGIPQVALVMGSCTAGGAYVPAMSDETVIVQGTGTIFLGGPPLVKAATGEDVTAEELGGSEVHTRRSGVADHEALDDEHALALGRSIVSNLNRPKATLPWDRRDPADPAIAAAGDDRAASLYASVSADARRPVPVREIIARLVDGSRFHEFKPLYGETLVTGFAHIDGYPVAILANDGILFSQSALKGAHFIELACQRKIPLVFLQNITGSWSGASTRRPASPRTARSWSWPSPRPRSPSSRSSSAAASGPGNYAMSGRAYQPRFLWSWPNARISVMGGAQAARVLSTVRGGFADDAERDAFEAPDPRDLRARGLARTSRRPASGTTGSSTRWTRGASLRSASKPRSTPRSPTPGSASSGCRRGRGVRHPDKAPPVPTVGGPWMSRVATRYLPFVVLVLVLTACATFEPRPSPSPMADGSGSIASTPGPAASLPPLPMPTRASRPPANPSETPAPSPPYTAHPELQVPQAPGTIIFGSIPGPLEDAWIEPYVTWPEGGMTYEARMAFGAFWGGRAGTSQIRITLYRVRGGTLDLVWTDSKRISPNATGFFDELVPFRGPGTYRLEVTRGPDLLAWGLAFMGPRCVSNCSGG